MKRLCVVIVAVIGLVAIQPREAKAVKAFKDHFGVMYAKKSKDEDFKKAVTKAGCNVCHIKGESKKKRNDYGMALSKLLKKKDYTPKRVKAEAEAVAKELTAAFKKVETVKGVTGKTFGALIKDGKLPGNIKKDSAKTE